jgi:hypothetical protein
VKSQLQIDGLDTAKESKSEGAQGTHGARLDQRKARSKLSDNLGKCEEDKAEKNSERTKEKVAQRSGDDSVMADIGRYFALPTTSEELTEQGEAAEKTRLYQTVIPTIPNTYRNSSHGRSWENFR